MTKTLTTDVYGTIDQIIALEVAGCDIVRVAVPDDAAAKALGAIKRGVRLPIIADIHFNYRLALEAIRQGVDGIRLNPGNIGARPRVEEVVRAAKDRSIPIRIGVNAGSLEKHLLRKYGPTPEAMVESALSHIAILEELGFFDTKVSLKASNVALAIDAYRLFAERSDYPLHLGITESGTAETGKVFSAVGLGVLLAEGIGDTIRVSLAADPVDEVKVGLQILRSLGLREAGTRVIACPSCGRCDVPTFLDIAAEVEREVGDLKRPLEIAVMGCEVNGPGEARGADIGVACGRGVGLIFRKGEVFRKVKEDEIKSALLDEVRKMADEPES
jgi:(E)-4-hydroxy-3-methylbut-2-enyl-diphosphate synthase